MRLILTVAAVLLSVKVCAIPQKSTNQTRSPSSVVEDFIKLELEGTRLAPQGWHKTSAFFVRSGPPPANLNILIVSDRHELSERRISSAETLIDLNFDHLYGSLDSSLHFVQEPDFAPNGAIIKNGLSASFRLVLADRYSELESNGQASKEVTAAPTWRIDPFRAGVLLDLRAAIRYVTEMRGKATDPVVRKNADTTLAILNTLK